MGVRVVTLRVDPCAVLGSLPAAECGTTVFSTAFGHERGNDEQGVDVNAKKALILAGAALLVFFLVTQPVQSAGIVTQILNTLKDGAEALITFVRNVFSG
jgi:hypothetical protein